MRPPRPKKSIVVALVLMTVVALIARLAGVAFLLPSLPEPDRYTVWQLEYLWGGGEVMRAPISFWWYPALVARTLAATPLPEVAHGGDLAAHLAAASGPILRVRLFVALTSVLVIPGTWLLARRFIGDTRALLAAALVATSLLVLVFSTQARLHAAQASFAVLAVVAALRLRERPTVPSYLVGGVAAALAVGILQNGVFVLPACGMAFLLRTGERSRRDWWKLGLAALPLPIVVLTCYPVLAASEEIDHDRNLPWGYEVPASVEVEMPDPTERRGHSGEFTEFTVRDGKIQLGPQRLKLERFNGQGIVVMEEELRWNDPVLYGLAWLGALLALVALARSRDWLRAHAGAVVVAGAYFVPMAVVMGTYSETKGRFMLPLLPYVATFAAVGGAAILCLLTRPARTPRARAALLALGTAVLLAFPVTASWRRVTLQRRPDTLAQAARWIEANTDAQRDRISVSPGLALPLLYEEEALQHNLREYSGAKNYWVCYQARVPAAERTPAHRVAMVPLSRAAREQIGTEVPQAAAYLRGLDADYVVFEVSQRTRVVPEQRTLIKALRRRADRVATFVSSEQQEQDRRFLDFQDCPHMAWRTLTADALGPSIEIYRLRP